MFMIQAWLKKKKKNSEYWISSIRFITEVHLFFVVRTGRNTYLQVLRMFEKRLQFCKLDVS